MLLFVCLFVCLFTTSLSGYNKCIFRICLCVCMPNLCYSFRFLFSAARAELAWIFPPRQITEICWLIAPLLCNLSLSLEFPLESSVKNAKHKSQLPLSQHPAPNSSANGGKKTLCMSNETTHRLASLIFKHLIVHQIPNSPPPKKALQYAVRCCCNTHSLQLWGKISQLTDIQSRKWCCFLQCYFGSFIQVNSFNTHTCCHCLYTKVTVGDSIAVRKLMPGAAGDEFKGISQREENLGDKTQI